MTQSLLSIFVPTLMVLVGILLNRGDANRLEARISQMESRLDGRLSTLEGRLNGLEARFHSDILMIVGKLSELEAPMARLAAERQDK